MQLSMISVQRKYTTELESVVRHLINHNFTEHIVSTSTAARR